MSEIPQIEKSQPESESQLFKQRIEQCESGTVMLVDRASNPTTLYTVLYFDHEHRRAVMCDVRDLHTKLPEQSEIAQLKHPDTMRLEYSYIASRLHFEPMVAPNQLRLHAWK